VRLTLTFLPKRYPSSRLEPSTPAAHEQTCLVLLSSEPDTIHKRPLRRTWPSTLLTWGRLQKEGAWVKASPLL